MLIFRSLRAKGSLMNANLIPGFSPLKKVYELQVYLSLLCICLYLYIQYFLLIVFHKLLKLLDLIS